MTSEFDIIAAHFAPLARDPGAFGLKDDVAQLPKGEYVVTKDMMIEGVHFLASDRMDVVARKLMRVNLSDLAAKGARPVGYVLACAWSKKSTLAEIALFAEGLQTDQDQFKITLFGGDTTRQKGAGPLVLSATFFGTPPRAGIVRRAGAAVGDDLWVSGTIGDAGLGLAVLQKRESVPRAHREALIARFHAPDPRVTLGGALAGVATAAIDVSDGLAADAGHIAAASGVGLKIDLARLPLSPGAAAWVAVQDDVDAARAGLAAFGDDYEILFTAPPVSRRAVEMAGKLSKTTVSRIGEAVKGEGAVLIGGDGFPREAGPGGWDHFRP